MIPLLKYFIKISFIMIAGKFRDLIHTFVRCSQQVRRPFEPDLLYICGVCESGFAFDDPVEVILLEM